MSSSTESQGRPIRRRRLAVGAVIAAGIVVGVGVPAAAHDPIFLTDDQQTPDAGPYLPDGAISWALYGTFDEPDDTRGFEFDLREGEELFISLLIPNLEPETALDDAALPYMELTLPDGEVRTIEPDMRTIFDEPFSGTSYVTLSESKEPALAGRHSVVVHSRAPSRFTVAVGEREEFFTPAERAVDRPTTFMEISAPLNAWYQTPPGADTAEVVTDDTVAIDVEMVEDEIDAMAEEASADESTAAGTTEAVVEAEPANGDGGEAASLAAEPEVVADADVGGDDDATLTWIAPVAIVAALIAGAVWFFLRRRSAEA